MKTHPNDSVNPTSMDGVTSGGLTKRELFAHEILNNLVRRSSMAVDSQDIKRLAQVAVSGADALIEELNK